LEVSELSDPEVSVAPWDVEEEVGDGAEAGFGCGFGSLRADALESGETLV
jgi:hypothetical protein